MADFYALVSWACITSGDSLSVSPTLSRILLRMFQSRLQRSRLLQMRRFSFRDKQLFLSAHIPLFSTFLNTTSKTRPFEYLRLTSLGVIGALVKQNDNTAGHSFPPSTEIIPLCLRIMRQAPNYQRLSPFSIVQKILLTKRSHLHLSYLRSFFRCRYCSQQHGQSTC